MTIFPTGTCFDDALDLLELRLQQGADPASFTLVHAICLAPEGTTHAGEQFAHAWLEESIEEAATAWQDGQLDGHRITYGIDPDELRRGLRVQREKRYTAREAWLQNQLHGTYGPWLPEYQDLCGRRRTFMPAAEAQSTRLIGGAS